MIRRFFVVVFAFALAVSAGAIFLPIAALVDPATREAGLEATFAGVFAMIDAAMSNDAPETAVMALGSLISAIFFATCVAPLAVAALIGEAAGVRAWTWYAGASATLAAASPWIARAARGLERMRHASPLEGRVALLFFLTGTVTGTLYWLVAARGNEPKS